MKPEADAGFWPLTDRCEGTVFCMYLDVLGLVTTAIGNLCDDPNVAASMPFKRDGKPATHAEIFAEHAAVKAVFCGVKGSEPDVKCAYKGTGKACLAHQGWKAAMKVTRLRLDADGVKAVVRGKLAANEAALVKRFPAFGRWPWQAQLATHSMAWACGPAFRFPKLAAALQADDFRRAAAECPINTVGNASVATRNKANVELYLAAVGCGLDAAA